jgi:uncharacterized protein
MLRKLLLCNSLFAIVIFIFIGCTTTINKAVYNNDFDLVTKLLENGNDINEKDQQMRTPIIYAAYVRSNLMLKYLIEKGANINEVDYKGCTALIYASYYGDYDNVKNLLNAGANIFIRNKEKYSAYEYAQYFGFKEIANLLKEKDADNLSKYPTRVEKKNSNSSQ